MVFVILIFIYTKSWSNNSEWNREVVEMCFSVQEHTIEIYLYHFHEWYWNIYKDSGVIHDWKWRMRSNDIFESRGQ